MLTIIGLGLKPEDITLEGIEEIKSAGKVYVENYTSGYAEGKIGDLEKIAGKQFEQLARKAVEEEFAKILEEAKSEKVAFCVYGNPFNATTHIQILLDAKIAQVKTKVIAGISVFEYVAATGLERYKFGRTTSIVFHEEDFEPESFYDAILENKKQGLHTLCLLDIKKEESKMMDIGHALALLERIEERREKNVLGESIIVGVAGCGSSAMEAKAGTMEQVKNHGFSMYPQSLIVCGKLNEKELEALRNLSGLE